MRLERSLARNDQFRVWKFLLENCEGAERSRHAFFRDQPAGLDETPAAVGGRIAPNKRKFVERNAGAIDPQTFRRTTEREQTFRERFRARQDERHRVEQILQLRSVIANILFLGDVGAVKRNDTRFVPALDERQQMHAGMPEINMHQVGATPFQQSRKHLIFAAINDGRLLFHPLKPAVPERISARLGNQLDVAKRKALNVLERLGHDERVVFVKRTHLPVDVEHLRFQECGAVTGYDWFGHGKTRRLSVRMRKLSTCYSQAATSALVTCAPTAADGSLAKSHSLSRFLKSSNPCDCAAEIATTSTPGKRFRRASRFSWAPGKSILFPIMRQGRWESRGS